MLFHLESDVCSEYGAGLPRKTTAYQAEKGFG